MTDHFELVVSPHFRPDGTKHPNSFDARLAGGDAVVCVSETPLLDAARALLAQGKANPDDMLVMRQAGSDHDALRARAGMAAGLMRSEPKGKGRLRLVRVPDLTTVWPSIEHAPSLVPEAAPSQRDACTGLGDGRLPQTKSTGSRA